jgi:putative transposase
MKTVVQLKLTPAPEVASVLLETLHAVNEQANWISGIAFSTGTFRNFALRKKTYAQVRAAGVGSQAAQHAIKKVADAYTTLKANMRAGNLGKPGSKRRRKAESKPIVFRPDAAQPYDQRNLSFALDAQTISLWTVRGRVKDIPFACSPEALKLISNHKRGECDLVHRDGTFYLIVTIDIPEPEPFEPNGFLGVDLGIVNIATTSDGEILAGRRLNRYRKRHLDLRRKLQKKQTKSAKRVLKRIRRREQRHAKDTNHVISKKLVTTAERTGHGLALEELTGIRDRVRQRKSQRSQLHSWAFAQLGQFVEYKAKRAGVPVVFVDPRYTSQQCCECWHTDKKNRVSQAWFACRHCGVVQHADRNGSRNIARRGEVAWQRGAVNHPNPATAG